MVTMRTNPTHHPSEERLLDYASGASAEPVSLLIATHLALCPQCRRDTAELEMLGGVLLEQMPPDPMTPESLAQSLARIMRPEELPQPISTPHEDLGDRSVPQPLRGYLSTVLDDLPWRRIGPISELLLLQDVPDHTTRLLRIRAGAAVPSHTHRGTELTLVLKGGYTDGKGHYLRGDVEEADGNIDHRPTADQDEDCFCLAVTDAPLKLTSRLGRLLNPFLNI